MLFKSRVLDGIKAGRITLAFRRWFKPTVRAGGTLRTPIGVLAIEGVEAIGPDDISGEDARRAGFDTRETLLADLRKGRGGALYRIRFHVAGPDPREALRQNDQLDADDLAGLLDQFAALDKNNRSGPQTGEARARGPQGTVAQSQLMRQIWLLWGGLPPVRHWCWNW